MDWIKAHKKWVLIAVLIVAALAIGGSFIEDEPAESQTEDEVESMTPGEKIESIIRDRLGGRVIEGSVSKDSPYIVSVTFSSDCKIENDFAAYNLMKELYATGYKFQAINVFGSKGTTVYKTQLTWNSGQAVDWQYISSWMANLDFYWCHDVIK